MPSGGQRQVNLPPHTVFDLRALTEGAMESQFPSNQKVNLPGNLICHALNSKPLLRSSNINTMLCTNQSLLSGPKAKMKRYSKLNTGVALQMRLPSNGQGLIKL